MKVPVVEWMDATDGIRLLLCESVCTPNDCLKPLDYVSHSRGCPECS